MADQDMTPTTPDKAGTVEERPGHADDNGLDSGAAAPRAGGPSGAEPTTKYCIGTLNLLGDALNPLEFLPVGDPAFMARYGRIEALAKGLPHSEVLPYIERIRALVPEHLWAAVEPAFKSFAEFAAGPGDGTVWGWFGDPELKSDNKIITPRVAKICHAVRLCSTLPAKAMPPGLSEGAQVWELSADQWVASLAALAEDYAKDPNLYVWDITMNVIAEHAGEDFDVVCRDAMLNPNRLPALAKAYFGTAAELATTRGILAIGVQEWPEPDSTAESAFLAETGRLGLEIVNGLDHGVESVALLYDASTGPAVALTGPEPGLVQPKDVMDEVIAAQPTELSSKELKGCSTTVGKTLAVRIGEAITVIVIHAKEPKTPRAAEVYAQYISALAARLPAPWICAADTNMPSPAVSTAFATAVEGVSVTPSDPTVVTTSKHRSILHGQCYNDAKCLVTVRAPKDRMIYTSGAVTDVTLYPPLEDAAGDPVTLPTPAWGSDHAMLLMSWEPPVYP